MMKKRRRKKNYGRAQVNLIGLDYDDDDASNDDDDRTIILSLLFVLYSHIRWPCTVDVVVTDAEHMVHYHANISNLMHNYVMRILVVKLHIQRQLNACKICNDWNIFELRNPVIFGNHIYLYEWMSGHQ